MKDTSMNGTTFWMMFVRSTMAVAWAIGLWGAKTLLSVDQTLAIVSRNQVLIEARLAKAESRLDLRDREELADFRSEKRRRE